MSDEPPSNVKELSQQPGRCPACGGPNGCRLESGEAFKGPCWCEELVLPAAAARRISDEFAEPRCLCRACLEAIAANPDITVEELAKRP